MSIMKIGRSTGTPQPEILWNSEYVGSALTLDETAFNESGVCKAGTPIDYAGKIANDENALGVLLYDVYANRPQGTIVVGGYINGKEAEKHSGVTVTPAARAAMKNVLFMPEEWQEGGVDE